MILELFNFDDLMGGIDDRICSRNGAQRAVSLLACNGKFKREATLSYQNGSNGMPLLKIDKAHCTLRGLADVVYCFTSTRAAADLLVAL